jgi:tol-pal system protein YbgF
MTRHWFWPPARATLLFVLCSVGAGLPGAQAQDAATQERLDRIERDLSMLQRQVYRDGASPADDTTGGAGNLAVDTQIRMNRLEQQMRELTGRVEEEANQVQRLRQRLEQINSDTEVRLGGPNPRARVGPPPPVPPGMRSQDPPPGVGETAELPGAMAPPPGALLPPTNATGTLTPPGIAPPPGAPPPPIDATGTLTPPGVAPPAGEGSYPAAVTPPSQSASAQYNSAFGLLRQADYQAAEDAFRSFVQQHPNSGLAGNAQYWLGESYYARGRYGDAAIAFAEGYRRYPKGAKASDTLLKLGMALGRAHQTQNACIALAQLDHDFPRAASPIKEREAAEKKRFGC